ncbi:MAG: hypothetical protein ACHQ51_10690, partial [Elusimicrobiota bacterium]
MADTPAPPTPPSAAAPTPGPGSGGWERQCLEALKAIGKALGQMALYKVGHPAVAETIRLARENLDSALALAPDGELVVSIDQQKLIANGRVIGTAAQLPNTILNLYNRFKLSSLTFRTGLSHEEIAGFCELAALRQDAAAATDPKAFLVEKGVTHLVLNEAVYLKAGEQGAGAGPGPGAGAGAGAGDGSGAGPGTGEGPGVGAGAGAGAGAGPGGGGGGEEQIRGITAAI